MRRLALFLIALLVAFASAEAKKAPVALKTLPPMAAQGAVQAKEVSLVRVNVTGQPFDYFRPWQKKRRFPNARSAPSCRPRALGGAGPGYSAGRCRLMAEAVRRVVVTIGIRFRQEGRP